VETSNLGYLGHIYRDLGHTEQAISYYSQALALARKIGYRRGEGNWLGELESIRYEQGRIDDETAVEGFRKALAIACGIEDRRRESMHLLRLARVELSAGRAREAQQQSEDARALEQPWTMHYAALIRGIALLHQGNHESGKAFADAIERCQDILNEDLHTEAEHLDVASSKKLTRAQYARATALVGEAVCGSHWSDTSNRKGLLAPACAEYERALENCSAKGVVLDAIRDLDLIRAAGIQGLEPVFALLESAIEDQ
jgi:tetratricopeptide (TPR) repeat protein